MKQRTSTRQVKVSKAFQVVDEDTRRSNIEQRLLALESDNYNERETLGMGNADDEAYESEEEEGNGRRKKRAKTAPKNKDIRSKWTNRPVKPLERLLLDNGISPDAVGQQHDQQQQQQQQQQQIINYYTIAAAPPRIRTTHPFCSVCGYLGHYNCTRCGSRYCSIKCNESHMETRCLKFSI
eukprot:gene1211-1322_t